MKFFAEFFSDGTAMLKKKVPVLLAAILCSFTLNAQTGNLSGVIADASSGESLPGANIYIEGIGMGTISDIEGKYRLSNIPTGTYSIVYQYVGYVPQTQKVTINPGETQVQDVSMVYDAVNIDEVVVTTQMLGQARAINQQLNSDALVNVISSDKMKELPDVNAAEAIGRLPGISVQRTGGEANKIVVRGLSPKLTAVSINGIRVPPTGGDDRSVNLSMISPELLSSIEVFKSPTADMDGDAVGGVVNLGVMKAPLKPNASIRLHGGYNGLDREIGNYKGMLDVSRRFMDDKFGVFLKANYENTNRSSENVSVAYDDQYGDDQVWPLTDANFTDDYRLVNRTGATLGLDYTYRTGEIVGQGFYSRRNNELITTTHGFADGTGVSHDFGHSESNLSVLQGTLTGKQRLSIFQMDYAFAVSQTVNDTYYDAVAHFGEPNGMLDTARVYSVEEKLDTRTYNYDDAFLGTYNFSLTDVFQNIYTAKLNIQADFNLGGQFSGFVKFGGQYRTENRARDLEPYRVSTHYLDDGLNDRAVANMLPDVVTVGGNTGRKVLMENFVQDFEPMGFWNNTYSMSPVFDVDYLDLWQERQQALVYEWEDPIRGHEKYEVSESVAAAYFMTKLNYSRWFTFIPGVRYEHSDNSYLGYVNSKTWDGNGAIWDTTTYQNYGVLLPSFHIKIKPLQWFDIRMSAVKTVSRPDYYMLVPRIRVDLQNARLQKGNFNLKHLEAWNYDLQFSFFDNKFGLFTIGGFYKSFDNYFSRTDRVMGKDEARELGIAVQVYDVTEDYVNFDDSEVYGFEIDLQSNLDYLPAPFNGIVFNANLSRLWSKTFQPLYQKVEYYDPALRRVVVDLENSYFEYNETSLPDQTEWISNFGIGYDYRGFSARLSMIYQSVYLRGFSSRAEVEGSQFAEMYTNDYLRFDASVTQRIGRHVKILLNFANITGESERSYQYLPRYWRAENRYGSTIDAGLQYTF
ncbi:MAG: carboxypeptidase-like regulatory domain-containing protein [Bacteroidales bacterium]|nr:carboxypeptidase-like regulatory domain-containing protein [Bacteroidales bacterium]MDT8432353.1 carboxypeptidase-like regulatory domain-containing protein [Bacteroidales bacterium]